MCIRTNKTILEVDNGIGVAIIIAIVLYQKYIHSPLEFCFTTCEEDNLDCIVKDLKPGDTAAK